MTPEVDTNRAAWRGRFWATRVRLAHAVEGVMVTAVSFAFCAWLTWPLAREAGDHIIGLGGDAAGTIAGLRIWAEQTGYAVTGVSHVGSIGAPFGYDQGNGVNLQAAFVFLPAYLITEVSGAIVAYNVVVLSGLALSGAAMYWLVRWLGCAPLVAAWAGLVFIVFPWHLEKAHGHSSLVHLEGFPLLLLAVFAWYRKPNLRRVLLVAAAVAVLWTTSGYFGLMAVAALPALFLPALVLFARERGLWPGIRRTAAPVAVSLGVPVVVYAVASAGTSEEGVAASRGLHELLPYGARPWEYLLPSYRNRYFGDDVGPWLAAHLHESNFSESSLYVGWITIVLAGGWLLWALVKRADLSRELRLVTVVLAAAVVTGLVFSLPSPLPKTGLPAPSRLIWEIAPQFRVPARFVALVMAALVPLAALGLEGVRRAVAGLVRPGAVAAAAGAAVCVVAGVLSFGELSILPSATVSEVDNPPAEYVALRRAPRGLLAEYPLAPSDQAVSLDYVFWQHAHGRPLVNGAPLGSLAHDVSQSLVDPATPGTAASLATLGASAIIVRPSTYGFTGGRPFDPTRPARGYQLLATTPGRAAVWRVTAAPARALAAFGEGFLSPETLTPRSTMRWMDSTGTVHLFATRRGVYEASFSVISYSQPRKIRIEGLHGSRTFDIQATAPRTVSLSLSLPRGRASLRVVGEPGSEPIPDGRMVTVYMSNWTLKGNAGSGGDAPLVPRPPDGSQ